LVDFEGILMLGNEREPILDVVGGAVMFTNWNPKLYPVTNGRSVGGGYPEVSNLLVLIVGSAIMTPSVPLYSAQFRRTVSKLYIWQPVMPGKAPSKVNSFTKPVSVLNPV
jgi:hypothetical protein